MLRARAQEWGQVLLVADEPVLSAEDSLDGRVHRPQPGLGDLGEGDAAGGGTDGPVHGHLADGERDGQRVLRRTAEAAAGATLAASIGEADRVTGLVAGVPEGHHRGVTSRALPRGPDGDAQAPGHRTRDGEARLSAAQDLLREAPEVLVHASAVHHLDLAAVAAACRE